MSQDVSQSMDRSVGRSPGKIGCLAGASRTWLFVAPAAPGKVPVPLFRKLLGEEAMALQGFTMSTCPQLRKASDKFLVNLAGNAFNLPCDMLVLFCYLAAAASF